MMQHLEATFFPIISFLKKKIMFKKVVQYILLAPLLMAFQCDDDMIEESPLAFTSFKVNITPQSKFSLNDTIWITGKISSKGFDISLNDSIFAEKPRSDIFSIYKFIEPTEVSNCKDAIDKFDLTFDSGEFTALPSCENAHLEVIPQFESNTSSYIYKIGLKPNIIGDYVISWQDGVLQNSDRNEFIINNYPIPNHPNAIGFIKCNSVSWRYLNESEREYYFTVTNN
jgi:hypothetical protein